MGRAVGFQQVTDGRWCEGVEGWDSNTREIRVCVGGVGCDRIKSQRVDAGWWEVGAVLARIIERTYRVYYAGEC